MIITGYQGIGKSTLAKEHINIIDLESSSFWKYEEDVSRNKTGNRTRPDDWYIYYCQIAQHLSSQGYIVFVSCHEQVRKWLAMHNTEPFYAIYPSLKLKEQWIKRLEKRYEQTKSEKDYNALIGAQKFYDSNIKQLMLEGGYNEEYFKDYYEIENINYDLFDIIKTFIKE